MSNANQRPVELASSSLPNMSTHEFRSFKEARAMATTCAFFFNMDVVVSANGKLFGVTIPDILRIGNIENFVRIAYPLGMAPDKDLLSLMRLVDRSEVSSDSHAWRDPETNLTWDVSRLFYGKSQSELPAAGLELMNALLYAGLSNWRLPTLDELRTLSVKKLTIAGVSCGSEDGFKFWSWDDSRREDEFLDLVSMRPGYQRYKEQDKNRHTRGDGYQEWAQTIMVSPGQSVS